MPGFTSYLSHIGTLEFIRVFEADIIGTVSIIFKYCKAIFQYLFDILVKPHTTKAAS